MATQNAFLIVKVPVGPQGASSRHREISQSHWQLPRHSSDVVVIDSYFFGPVRSCVERRSKENTSMIKWTAPVATRLLPSPRCPGWRIRKTNAAAFSPLARLSGRRVCSLGWLWSPSSGHSARPWLWQHRIWQINFFHFTNNRCVNWKIQHNRDRN